MSTTDAMTSYLQARVPRALDDALLQYAHERGLSRSEATRSLLEMGLVAAIAAAELPEDVKAYRLIAEPHDADDDDVLLFPE